MDLTEAQNDPEVQNLLKDGVEYITQQEVLAQKIPDATYTVSQLRSVWTQVVSGINYRFDVDITNDLGWALRATFVVYSQPWTETQNVTSYVYTVTNNPNPSEEEEFVIPNEEDIAGAYEPIDPSELDTDSDLKNALEAGVEDVIGQAVADHELPDSTYEVTQIHSIYGQVVSGMNYRFDVDLTNCAGLVARAVFVVYSEPWTNTLETTSNSLRVTSIPEEGLIGGDCPNEGGNNEEEYNIEEEAILVGGYTPVDLDEANNDPTIQELLNFGAQYVARQGIQSNRLPDSRYVVSQVYSVAEQVVAGINYRFEVELANCQGLTVRATYVVYYVPWEGTREVTDYNYDITAAPNGPLTGGCPDEGGEEENTWIPGEEEDILAGGWSTVDPQDAEKDEQLQEALKFGVEEFAKQATASGEIPAGEYQLGEVNGIEQQVVNGMNYRFDVNVVGNSGSTVRVILEVYSQSWSNTLKLTSYNIQG